MNDQLQKLLSSLPPEDRQGFFQLWEAIYQARITGPVTVHCFNGIPKQMSIGQPILLSIAEGQPSTGLDTQDKAPPP